MARRRRKSGAGSLLTRTITATFQASHTVPAVGFLLAAVLGIAWWKLRGSESTAVQWSALALGVLACFFALVALIGFLLIVLERLAARPRR